MSVIVAPNFRALKSASTNVTIAWTIPGKLPQEQRQTTGKETTTYRYCGLIVVVSLVFFYVPVVLHNNLAEWGPKLQHHSANVSTRRRQKQQRSQNRVAVEISKEFKNHVIGFVQTRHCCGFSFLLCDGCCENCSAGSRLSCSMYTGPFLVRAHSTPRKRQQQQRARSDERTKKKKEKKPHCTPTTTRKNEQKHCTHIHHIQHHHNTRKLKGNGFSDFPRHLHQLIMIR